MARNSKVSHSHQQETRSQVALPAGVRTETVVILVVAAFFLGVIVGAIWAILKNPPPQVGGSMPVDIENVDRPTDVSGRLRDIQIQTELAQRDPENPDVWIELGDLFSGNQQHDKAIEAYTKAVVLQPGNTDPLVRLGNAYFDRGVYEEAVTAYSKALAIDPRNADVLTDLGVAYRRTKSPEKALNAFRKAADIDPMHTSSRYNQGVVLFHDLNDTEGAIRAWQAFLQIEPRGERAEKVKQMLVVLKAMPPGQKPPESEE